MLREGIFKALQIYLFQQNLQDRFLLQYLKQLNQSMHIKSHFPVSFAIDDSPDLNQNLKKRTGNLNSLTDHQSDIVFKFQQNWYDTLIQLNPLYRFQ